MLTAVVLAPPTVSLDVERQLLSEVGVGLTTDLSVLPEADVLLVFSCRVDAVMLSSLTRCRGVVCFSTGTDHVDLEAAALRGIPVRNVPDYATQEVAEHALALLLACARKLVVLHTAGTWNWRPVAGEVHSISGRTLGVVGLGRIGRRFASLASGIGMRTVAYDPYWPSESIPLNELLEQSDFVSLHAPLTSETHHLINAASLARMKRSAFLINTARGGLVDEGALLAALLSGDVAGAALDVREQEPPPEPDPLATLSNVILTPHVGAYSVEAAERLHREGTRLAIELLAATSVR